ncbi:hypothetical protein DFQ28_007180 [Apophysomyces sp. BC1034]|nr:hypothetical protein DFQ30_008955 [Apophysomyces sp. BC1015]KAG0177065.1 hypothetical protein DFQ29_005305 [Apophysomyces sp. BC1021]KAG0186886.1 hypothetical protein DFQ28_007180 [Apophysomyces sp. BC1034]
MSNASTSCRKYTSAIARGLGNVLATTPYAKLLMQRQYVKLTPNVKYFSAKTFAGFILENKANGQAVLVNTVEVYGRTKNVDATSRVVWQHEEQRQDNIPATAHQDHVSQCVARDPPEPHGLKLVIGTQVSNALVTSCIRMDTKLLPSVGSAALNFKLSIIQDSLQTKIYLDHEYLQEALTMINSPGTSRISDTAIICQLRQIRSKYELPTAHTLCRASGPLTASHICHPYTIFTLADYDPGRSPGAKLFRAIGVLVLKHGKYAQLSKD